MGLVGNCVSHRDRNILEARVTCSLCRKKKKKRLIDQSEMNPLPWQTKNGELMN